MRFGKKIYSETMKILQTKTGRAEKMKRLGTLLLTAVILAATLMTGCGKKESEEKETLSVVFYANGSFGDNAYFDGNKEGVLRAEKELGVRRNSLKAVPIRRIISRQSRRWQSAESMT